MPYRTAGTDTFAVGYPIERPRRSPGTTSPAISNGRPSIRAANSTPPDAMAARMVEDLTSVPWISTIGVARIENPRSAPRMRSVSTVPAAPFEDGFERARAAVAPVQESVQRALAHLGEIAGFVKVLGSYRRDELPD